MGNFLILISLAWKPSRVSSPSTALVPSPSPTPQQATLRHPLHIPSTAITPLNSLIARISSHPEWTSLVRTFYVDDTGYYSTSLQQSLPPLKPILPYPTLPSLTFGGLSYRHISQSDPYLCLLLLLFPLFISPSPLLLFPLLSSSSFSSLPLLSPLPSVRV